MTRSTRGELMIMQKGKNLMIAKIAGYWRPRCQDNKVSDRNFCSGFSVDLLRSYLQSSSSSCVFSFSLLPRGSRLIFPASYFHAIMRRFVLTQDELHGFKGKLLNSLGHIIT